MTKGKRRTLVKPQVPKAAWVPGWSGCYECFEDASADRRVSCLGVESAVVLSVGGDERGVKNERD